MMFHVRPRKLIWIYMDTQNDGLEMATPFKYWPFLVSMSNFWGVSGL